MRPGGRAVSVAKGPLRVRSSCGGVSSFGAGTPVQLGATHGEGSKENRARGSGSGQWRCFDNSTSTFGTQPSTATPLGPAPPSDGV